MTENFAERIRLASNLHRSRLVLALDPSDADKDQLLKFADNAIDTLGGHVCAIKMNFHMLLPLDTHTVRAINELAHSNGLQAIADIKLNDIGNTNDVAVSHLWAAGFDALTVNPFMGFDALKDVIANAHAKKNGVITLVYMSHRSAADTYGMLAADKKHVYEIFLDWAEKLDADGIVVGATVPEIIKQCSQRVQKKIAIYSPGVGVQGGDAKQAIASGSNYLIVGRSIIGAADPAGEASRMQELSWSS